MAKGAASVGRSWPALRIGNVTRSPVDADQQFLNAHFFRVQSLRVPPSLAQELLALPPEKRMRRRPPHYRPDAKRV